MHISLGFFEDVVVPPHGLPESSFYKEDEKVGGLRATLGLLCPLGFQATLGLLRLAL